MITLTEENEIRLTNIKEKRPDFKLSRWVQKAFNDITTIQTVEDAEAEIIRAENIIAGEKVKADNLKRLLKVLVKEEDLVREQAEKALSGRAWAGSIDSSEGKAKTGSKVEKTD